MSSIHTCHRFTFQHASILLIPLFSLSALAKSQHRNDWEHSIRRKLLHYCLFVQVSDFLHRHRSPCWSIILHLRNRCALWLFYRLFQFSYQHHVSCHTLSTQYWMGCRSRSRQNKHTSREGRGHQLISTREQGWFLESIPSCSSAREPRRCHLPW